MIARDLVRAVLDYLAGRKQLALLPQVAEALAEAALIRTDPDLATVTTAIPLSGEQKLRLKTTLKQVFGRPVRLNSRVDPGLIGGLRIGLAGRVIDLSLEKQLDELQETVLYA